MDDANELEFTANVAAPLQLKRGVAIDWDESADIVVVGFGGAGVVACLQALEDHASVIAVDRFGGGGATIKSGGVVYAGGTKYLKQAGYDDSAEEMFNYLSHEGTPVRPDTLRRFCETSAGDLDWISSFGVKFGSTVYEDRIAYPPDPYFLYYTGMEKFRNVAKPAPRGHRTMGKGPTGKNYFPPLRDAALAKGTRLFTHSPVRRLVVDDHGRVLGVEIQVIPDDKIAEHEILYQRVNPYKILNGATAEKAIAECEVFERNLRPQRKFVLARKGVILASGGYNYNLKMFSRYRPVILRAYKEIVRGGSMGCDGSGIELGQSVGGNISHMDRLFVTKPISPPNAFVAGILVNLEGKRFITEDAYLGNVGCAVAEQSHDGAAWLILDQTTFWRGVRQATWPIKKIFSWWGLPAILNLIFGGTKRARSIAALAGLLNIAPLSLQITIENYNENAGRGVDPDQAKLPQHLLAQDKAPYYAINMSLRNKWGMSGAMPYGGLTVDEDTGAVLRAGGSVISGLYAAGRTAVGVCSESNFSGLSIADTIFSGRRAARAAVRRNQSSLQETNALH